MNISKISRSLVVVIFVAFIVFLSYLNITGMIKSDGTPSVSSNLIKLAYGVVLVTLVLIYVYIKDKLYKLKIKRKISFIYRYIYISIVIISTNILTIYTMFTTFSIKDIIVHMAMLSITSFVIKRIIFNVSKSDILSVFGMFLFSMLPNIIEDKSTYFVSSAIMLVMCITILFLQVTIDELKQRGLKTNKYIILSIILAIFIAICMIMGINMFFWLTIAVILFFITINLDKTHINFPKKIMNSITQAKREALYTIERININKLIVVVSTVFIVSTLVFFIGSNIVIRLQVLHSSNETLLNITQNLKASQLKPNIEINNIINCAKCFVSFSSTYYMIIFIYIVFMEILSVMLHRRYDTKSTILKLSFVLLFMLISNFSLNLLYFQPMLTILLILIAIVDTSNIYLNREERIKMLVA